jgi:hypothetical protein
MSVESISRAAEQRILQATGRTVDLVQTGYDPTAAVVKAASELSLPAGHSRLVARAYNVAKTNQQRELGNTILEKTAEFPLADGDAAEAELFPTSVQTKKACTDVSIEYFLPPTFLTQKAASESLIQNTKQAAELLGSEVRETPAPERFNSKTAYAKSQQARILYEQVRAETSQAFDQLSSGFSDLQSYFQMAKQADYANTIEHASLTGNTSALLAMALVRPALAETIKTAKASKAVHSQRQQQYILLESIKSASSEYAKKLNQLWLQKAALEETLPRISPKRLGSESILGAEKTAAGFMSGLLGSTAGSTAGNAVHDAASGSPWVNSEKAYGAAVDAIQDPEHESQLKNIRTQAMLHSLMLHDPVIKGYNPNEVLNAFNEISQTAPRISDQTLVMQPLLRKRLSQGVLDPFEVSQIMTMDKQQAKPAAGGSNSVLS